MSKQFNITSQEFLGVDTEIYDVKAIANSTGTVVDFDTLIGSVNTAIGDIDISGQAIKILDPDNTPVDFSNLTIDMAADQEIRITNSDGSPIDLDTLFGDVNTNLGTIDTSIGDVNSNLDAIEVLIGTTNSTLETIDTSLGSIDTSLGSIDTNIGTVNTNLGTIDTNITAVNTNLDAVEVLIGTSNTELGEANDNLDSIETKLDTLDASVNAIDVSGQTVNISPITDLSLTLAMGEIDGTIPVIIFGVNESSQSNVQEDMWQGDETNYTYPSTADITHISQETDEVGMRGANIQVRGLDVNWAEVTQTAVLDGTDTTTIVALGTPLIRIFKMSVFSNFQATERIMAHNAGNTITYDVIAAGTNESQLTMYTIPAGKTGYMTSYHGDISVTVATSPKGVLFLLWAADRANGYGFMQKHGGGVEPDGSRLHHEFGPYMKYTEKTDIKMTVNPNDHKVAAYAGFTLILVDNV